jgi:cellulose synthase/poly-beta-1,6-N-acetylglucosamine synthase-like glycosyltransferase
MLIIFFISILLIAHTYLFYPTLLLLFFSKNKKQYLHYISEDELPAIAILVAAYNEERVIEEKIKSVYATNYPGHKLRVLVGSDASTDRTEEILETLKKTYPALEYISFSGRIGKIKIINHLQSLCEEEILVLTDANVFFKPNTLFELIKNFKDERVGIVAANIIKESLSNEGVAFQEKTYLSLENKIKTSESNLQYNNGGRGRVLCN